VLVDVEHCEFSTDSSKDQFLMTEYRYGRDDGGIDVSTALKSNLITLTGGNIWACYTYHEGKSIIMLPNPAFIDTYKGVE
jgi:hypothetical protein